MSGLFDKMSEANLQADDHVEVQTQGVKDQWELEGEDSSLICLPSSSPAQRSLSRHPNMKYCLEIRVMLTEELGAILTSCHSWDGPIGRRHAVQSKNKAHQSSGDRPRYGSSFLWEAFNGRGSKGGWG